MFNTATTYREAVMMAVKRAELCGDDWYIDRWWMFYVNRRRHYIHVRQI